VFTASAHDVRDVWVQGHHLVENGTVVSVDVAKVAADAQAAAEDLFERRRRLTGRPPDRWEVPAPAGRTLRPSPADE
jgi:hypothetical protein